MFELIKIKGKRFFRGLEEEFLGQKIIDKSDYSSPDFLIVGAAKSGTTSLFQYLAQHPQIIPSKEKELLYFSVNQEKGLRWYLHNFPKKTEKMEALTFEASPSYMYYPKGLERISKLFPEVKLIIILREPVSRSYSQWAFHTSSNFVRERPYAREHRSFTDSIRAEIKNPGKTGAYFQYLSRSTYSVHLKKIYDLFPKERVLILSFEEFKADPYISLNEVTNFLGVRSIYQGFEKSEEKVEELLQTKDESNNNTLKVYNSNDYNVNIDSDTLKFLKDYFKPFNDELQRLTEQEFDW